MAVRFYQQSLVTDEWTAEEVHEDLNNAVARKLRQKGGPTLIERDGPTTMELTKDKKGS